MMVCDRVTRGCWRRVEGDGAEGDVVWGGGSIRVTRKKTREKGWDIFIHSASFGGTIFKVGGAGFKCPLVIQILFKALGLNQFGLAYHFVYLVFFSIIYNIQNSE